MENPFQVLFSQIENLERHLLEVKNELYEIKQSKGLSPGEALSIQKAAAYLNLSKASVYKFVSTGQIPHHKKGKRLYFYREELDAWIISGRRKTNDELKAEARKIFSS